MKVKSLKHVSLRRKGHALKFFKYNDLTDKLNSCIIPAKQHQVIHSRVTDKISILKTLLCKYLEFAPLILFEFCERSIISTENTSP